jgi:hypothetical protein
MQFIKINIFLLFLFYCLFMPSCSFGFLSFLLSGCNCILKWKSYEAIINKIDSMLMTQCSRNHCFLGKAVRVKYSESVFVALINKHAKRMRRIILSSVTCLSVPHSSTLSRNCYFSRILMTLGYSRHIFEKSSNIKFYENPSSAGRVVPCG